MKNSIIKSIFAVCLSMAALSSCKKQLEITPQQSIVSETALNTKEEINASIVTMYSLLKSPRLYGRDLIALPDALADNGYANGRSGRFLGEAQNSFPIATTGANHFTSTLWVNSYAAINQINLTLEAIPALPVVPAPTTVELANWNGQLYFLRGLYYFELMRAYAYIPGAVVAVQNRGGVVVNPQGFKGLVSSVNYKPSRQSIDSVYRYIIADLLRAEPLLTNQALEKNIATKAAARALLCRVYLYMKDYANAKLWADNAITTFTPAKITDVGNYVSNWRSADNTETIFQIRFALNSENIGVNESLQTSFTTLTSPGLTAVTGGFGDLVPTIPLLTDLGITLASGTDPVLFTSTTVAANITARSGDVRNLLYEVGTSGRSRAYVECTKYLGKNGFINLDNVPVLRLSEMYLNRAEAFATIGSPVYNVASALADLKFIKSRRYVGYTGSAIEIADNALTPTQLYDEIIRQKRIEFAFEGHRFFDLKRLGLDVVKGAPYNFTVLKTEAKILPPIPQADVDGNSNLQQNFGY